MLNSLLQKYFKKNDASKDVAKKRLKLALIYDQIDVSDNMLENLQKDIVNVISRYFVIDSDSIQLDIQRSEDLSALVFNTPIIKTKHKQREHAV